jgi:hypothetical protein
MLQTILVILEITETSNQRLVPTVYRATTTFTRGVSSVFPNLVGYIKKIFRRSNK